MNRWLPAGALFALAAGLVIARADDPGTGALLERIRKVGREGAGNAEAAKAWKALVAKGPEALVPILRAMNDDEPTAANWLRPAFEAVAEKALAGGKLSKDTLEKFVADKAGAGTARRLAYEWLVKLDKTAPDRLLPGMLRDPSAELRRDAVERVVKEAEAKLEKKDEKAARALFEKALSGACDPEQVDAVAAALGKLGVKVDVAKHQGFVRRWYLIAAFEHAKGTGWAVAYPPEKGVDVAATYKGKDGKEAKWVEHATADPHGVVDLNMALGKMKGTVAYAAAYIDSPAARPVELRFGSMNGLKVFVNGKEVFAREEYHHGMRQDQYAARAPLKKGRNVILLKVCQNEQEENWAQDWKFQLRLCEPVGAAVAFTEVVAPAKEKN
jgi:hypothetical protein